MLAERTRKLVKREIRAWLKNGANDFAEVAWRFEQAHSELAERLTTRDLMELIEEARDGR